MDRVYNFSAGPATLPLTVLKEAQEHLLNYNDSGMSIMEMSHRSKDFQAVVARGEAIAKELLDLPEDYKVLFLQGGASLQFSMIPMNFLGKDKIAYYVETGSFAQKAFKEALKIGQAEIVYSGKENSFKTLPQSIELPERDKAAYLHITSNNTIYGTQWREFPQSGEVPLVADMSSDIMSRPIPVEKFSLIYAGAQKNLGPAGVTLVIIKKDLLDQTLDSLPSMLRYDLHAENNSLYNTPPSFSIYVTTLVMEWIKEQGGLKTMEKKNIEKAALIYDVIDSNPDFYKGHADKNCRSIMNVTLRLPTEEMEKDFIEKAQKEKLVGLKGHRSVGGIRASIYNAMPREGCEKLANFMKKYVQNDA